MRRVIHLAATGLHALGVSKPSMIPGKFGEDAAAPIRSTAWREGADVQFSTEAVKEKLDAEGGISVMLGPDATPPYGPGRPDRPQPRRPGWRSPRLPFGDRKR